MRRIVIATFLAKKLQSGSRWDIRVDNRLCP